MTQLFRPCSDIQYPEIFRGKLCQGIGRYTMPNKKQVKRTGKFCLVLQRKYGTPYLLYCVSTRGRFEALKASFPEGLPLENFIKLGEYIK